MLIAFVEIAHIEFLKLNNLFGVIFFILTIFRLLLFCKLKISVVFNILLALVDACRILRNTYSQIFIELFHPFNKFILNIINISINLWVTISVVRLKSFKLSPSIPDSKKKNSLKLTGPKEIKLSLNGSKTMVHLKFM